MSERSSGRASLRSATSALLAVLPCLILAATAAAQEPLLSPAARWIWDGGAEAPVDAYRIFRRAFDLPARPAAARLRISADAGYRLFINGVYVTRGPAPNPPSHATVDEIDVAARLVEGRNAIAVVVHHAGVPTLSRVLGRAGVVVDLATPQVRLVSDATWRWREGWWVPTHERITPMRGFTEHLDARLLPEGFAKAAFDDAAWKAAVPIEVAPWRDLEPRDIPMPVDRVVHANAVLFTGACDLAVPEKTASAAILARAPERPAPPGAVSHRAALATPDGAARVDASSTGVVLALDFGREVSGFPEIEVDAEEGGVVLDLGYGEGLDARGRVTVTKQGFPACDRLTLGRGVQTLRTFHHRAFRHLVLAVRGGVVVLKAPRVVESAYPVEPRGAFSCSDPLLDRVWNVASRTLALCMDDAFMDCPWRERAQYVGDAFIQGPAAMHAFGDVALMRRFLRQAALVQPPDGLLEPAFPSDWTAWQKSGRNRIPGFGALWIVALAEHVRATGDVALAERLAPVVARQLGYFRGLRATSGLVESVPEWNFIDGELNPDSARACLNLLVVLALRAKGDLDMLRLGAASRPAALDEAASISGAFTRKHWNESRGVFEDSRDVVSVHANALALLALDLDPPRVARILAGVGAPGVVQVASPFFDGLVLRALARHGRHAEALELVRHRYGPMLDAGASTFWEGYEPTTSLCHAWACEPLSFLARDVLGVAPISRPALPEGAAGAIAFAPRPAGLSWAAGVVPLPIGDVAVRFDVAGGVATYRITAPEGVAIAVDVLARDGEALSLDGGAAVAPDGGRVRLTAPRAAARGHVLVVKAR